MIYNKADEDWYHSVILCQQKGWRNKVKQKRLTQLSRVLLAKNLTKKERTFVKYLILNYKTVICGKATDLYEVIERSRVLKINPLRENFSKLLSNAFGYDNFKKHLGKELVKRSGIKICPYCQMQYTLITTSNDKHVFEYDHFFPQTKYPYLSISLYNLIPSCGNCNRIKLDDDEIIPHQNHPYTGTSFFNQFKYQIDSKDIIYEYLDGNRNFEIITSFEKGLSQVQKDTLIAYFNKFKIEGLMNHHSDIAEELVQKKLYYTFNKKWELVKIYNEKLFKTPEEVERFIVGNYTNPKDHLKRPLAKFQTDIAKQLKLI